MGQCLGNQGLKTIQVPLPDLAKHKLTDTLLTSMRCGFESSEAGHRTHVSHFWISALPARVLAKCRYHCYHYLLMQVCLLTSYIFVSSTIIEQ